MRSLIAVVALASVLAACGSAQKSTAPAPETHACRVITAATVADARLLLHDYGGDASPADLPFYDLRVDLANTQARCRPAWLGADLSGAFSRARLATLYGLLPATYVTYLQLAVSCAGDDTGAGCDSRPRTIDSPGSTGSGSTPHPVKP